MPLPIDEVLRVAFVLCVLFLGVTLYGVWRNSWDRDGVEP